MSLDKEKFHKDSKIICKPKVLLSFFVFIIVIVLFCYTYIGVFDKKVERHYFETSYMLETRGFGHTATLMKNNEILISGGCYDICPAEIFNPKTGQSRYASNPSINRWHNAQTILLDDGRILFAGGDDSKKEIHPEIFNPKTNKFELMKKNSFCTSNYVTLAKLDNGKVFMTCGNSVLFNPEDNSFSEVKNMYDIKGGAVSVSLLNNNVMIIGLIKNKKSKPEKLSKQTLIFNYKNKSLELGPSMVVPRLQPQILKITGNKVLFVGGHSGSRGNISPNNDIQTIEVYDADTNCFKEVGRYKKNRHINPAVFWKKQKIYFFANNRNLKPACEIFDLSTGETNYTHICQSKTKSYVVPINLLDESFVLVGGVSTSKNPKSLREILVLKNMNQQVRSLYK